VVELTNLETGESIVYEISGPVFFSFSEDGSVDIVLGGRSLLFFFPGEVEDIPLLFVNSGQVTLHIGPQGNIVSVDQVGEVTDVCAALA
jgi:hypothetical protein